MAELAKWIDALIPDKLKGEPEVYRKARIINYTHLLLAIVNLLSFAMVLFLPFKSNINNGLGFLGLFLLLVTFKYIGSITLSGNLIVLTLVAMIAPLPFHSGGIYSMDTIFLVTAPALAYLLAGRNSGIFWTIALYIFFTYLYFLESGAEVSYRTQTVDFPAQYYFYGTCLLFLSILGTIFIYETQKSSIIKQLKDQRKTLQDTQLQLKELNTSLEKKVKERTIDLEKTNLTLTQSNADLERFAYIASHDLQEPLRMVGNFVQLLEEEYHDELDDSGKTYIQFAVDGVKRMSRLITELLQYSRMHRYELNPNSIHLPEFFEKIKHNLIDYIKNNNALIDIQYPDTQFTGDQKLLEILFFHLMDNGLKFNKSNSPKINVYIKEEKSHWNCTVKDNGIGIESEKQEEIFKAFRRLNRKEIYEGTGIGLALCKKIVALHLGDIHLNSTPGKGSTFYFTLSKTLPKKEIN